MLPALITILQGAVTVAPAVEAAIRMRRSREPVSDRDIVTERQVLQQTWQTYEFQWRQRNLSFGMFVITIALLAVGYTIGLVGDLPVLAAANAGAGALLLVFLNRFDAVYRARVRETERAFRDLDERLVTAGDPSRTAMVPRSGGLSQDVMLLLFQTFAFWGFIVAFVYAVIDAL